jgi:hypothetical protein
MDCSQGTSYLSILHIIAANADLDEYVSDRFFYEACWRSSEIVTSKLWILHQLTLTANIVSTMIFYAYKTMLSTSS